MKGENMNYTSKTVGKDYEWFFLTPEVAQQFLSNMVKNRNVKPDKVKEYRAMLRAGKTRCDAPIKFFSYGIDDKENAGKMFDGQHRCYAVIEEGVPMWVLVKRNCPADEILYTDNGASRKSNEQMKFMHPDDAVFYNKNSIAIMGAIWQELLGTYPRSKSTALSAAEVEQFGNEYYAICDYALHKYNQLPKHCRHSAIAAVLVAAKANGVPEITIDGFIESISCGFHTTGEVGNDAAARCFAKWYVSVATNGGRQMRVEIIKHAKRALYSFASNRDKTTKSPEKLYPLDEIGLSVLEARLELKARYTA